jgi:hypothetical protein
MIPSMMISEMPFPTPLSVIRSPNQRINILPAARMIVAGNMNTVHEIPLASAEPACIFRLIR